MLGSCSSSHRLELLKRFSVDYQEINGSYIETLETPPTALEFLRIVHIGRPVIIRGLEFDALNRWTEPYLRERMGSNEISIAVTPDGYADAITTGPDGTEYFVEPLTEKMNMGDFLSSLQNRSTSNQEIRYLQSQNGNLFQDQQPMEHPNGTTSEFVPLQCDVPKDIDFASEALGKAPDAVNIWIGDERSITSVHSDPYENIYTVVKGSKHFTLFPPTEGWCLQERIYPHATYTRSDTGSLVLTPTPDSTTRWSSVADPTDPLSLPPEAKPIYITLQAGDSMYLPAGWWHHVRQSGITIALNWWYDLEVRGIKWVWLNFLRGEVEETREGSGQL